MKSISVVIADTTDFSLYSEFEKEGIPVVKRAWINECAKNTNLQPLRPYSPDPRYFMKGINATCLGLSIRDCEAIYGGISALGGEWSSEPSDKTTHIISMTLENEGIVHDADKIKVVLPHWIDDCLRLRQKLDETAYEPPYQSFAKGSQARNAGACTRRLIDLKYLHLPKSSVPQSKAELFDNKKFYLSSDILERDSVEQVIVQGGGSIVDSLDYNNIDAYVGSWREGSEYMEASQNNIVIGSPVWIYWMAEYNQWTSPIIRLLHYPLARHGIPSMKGMVISVSNYIQDARSYIKALVIASGATLKNSLTADVTHLIAARPEGKRVEAARHWNINVVNHLWLEDSYASWEAKSPAQERYIYYPEGIDLSEVVGTTSLDPKFLRKLNSEDSQSSQSVLEAITTTFMQENTPRHSMVEPITPAMSTKENARQAYSKSFEETPSKSANGNSASKLFRIHERILAPIEVPRSAPQMKRKGEDDDSIAKRHKRSNPTPLYTATNSSNDQSPMYIVRTGIKNKVPLSHVRLLSQFDIYVTENAKLATHVIAPGICRTQKFLISIANGPVLLNTNYLADCVAERKRLPVEDYLLCDAVGEAKFGRTIPDIMERALQFNGTLLKGYTFNLTPGLRDDFKTFEQVVGAHGGACVEISTPSKMASLCKPSEDGSMILISSSSQRSFISMFKDVFKTYNGQASCFPADCLLVSILRMEVFFDPKMAL